MRATLRFTLLTAFLLMAFAPTYAAAPSDIAPPMMPAGSNIKPFQSTNVRMMWERVLIDVQAAPVGKSIHGEGYADNIIARVTADFSMRNLGKIDEKMRVIFPLNNPEGNGDHYDKNPLIRNFSANVNGRITKTDVISSPSTGDGKFPVYWSAFDVTFPGSREVQVQVSYVLSASGYLPVAFFYYTLQTGAAWQGTIGRADIIVRLPYAASSENLLIDHDLQSKKVTLSGSEARWAFEEFEPTAIDDFRVALIAPQSWQNVLQARNVTAQRPNDASAWQNLGRAYARIITDNKALTSNVSLRGTALTAYERAVQLATSNVDLRAEYLSEFFRIKSFTHFEYSGELQDASAIKFVNAAKDALRAFPNNPKISKALEGLPDSWKSAIYESQVTPLPTFVPVATSNVGALQSPLNTPTTTFQNTPTPIAQPTPSSGMQLGIFEGGVFAIAIGLIALGAILGIIEYLRRRA